MSGKFNVAKKWGLYTDIIYQDCSEDPFPPHMVMFRSGDDDVPGPQAAKSLISRMIDADAMVVASRQLTEGHSSPPNHAVITALSLRTTITV